MTRAIKFRAWDREDKRLYVLEPFDGIQILDGQAAISPGWIDEGFHLTESGFALMQSTGLKDKNGVEIYEGDILKGNLLEPDQIEVVKWNDKGAGFDPFGFGEGFEFDESYSQVIGNLYENPGLIDKNGK